MLRRDDSILSDSVKQKKKIRWISMIKTDETFSGGPPPIPICEHKIELHGVMGTGIHT